MLGPRQQGDIGELSAMEWLVSQGASVCFPIGHSPDVDLVAWIDGRWCGVQVKTCTVFRTRWEVTICTRGGNRSWSGIVKHFDASRCDFLFVHVGDGRRWFIPAREVGGGTHIALGGPKYERFEVERGRPIGVAA